MSLRILGGTFKGRTLLAPKGSSTRPTLGIVRQAVFNICQFQIEGSRFLDLFAGSGAMGLEALSRGASFAAFVEGNRMAAACIRNNVENLGLEAKSKILAMDCLKAIAQLAKAGETFDFIYIDPPYAKGPSIADVLEELDKCSLLSQDGRIFAEDSSDGKGLIYESPTLKKKDTRSFGIARLHQFEREDPSKR